MHELGIAQEIINIAGQYIPQNSNPVKYVKVKIGKLSNVLIDSLLFGYEALSENTPFKNSKLLVEEIPITFKCNECDQESTINELMFLCPKCNSAAIEVIAGTELQVSEIELED